MGSTISSAMEESQGKMMAKQAEMQANMLSRQIAMQKAIAARQMAATRARAKDMLYFYGAFATLAFPVLIGRARASGNPLFLAPVVIITFVSAYQADMAFGNKLERIRADAEQMLHDSPDLFNLPAADAISVPAIDAAIAATKSDARAPASDIDERN